MGFSLGRIAAGIATGGLSEIPHALSSLAPSVPNAPQLPNAPTLQAPTLPQYPGFSPQQQQLLQQQLGAVNNLQNFVGAGQNTGAYGQLNNQVSQQELQNYQNALTGNIAPNQAIEQQKARDWAQTVEQAGQQGIRLSGDSPESAVSQSTAGNQIIQDFTKRYGALEQNYNLGQQQLGATQNLGRLGLQNQQYGTQVGAYGDVLNQLQQAQNPYQQQTLGQFGVATNQALANTATTNQNLSNQYQGQLGQTTANYNNALLGYQQNMGLINNLLSLGGQIGGAALTHGASTVANNPATNPGNQYIPYKVNVNQGGPYGSSLGLAN